MLQIYIEIIAKTEKHKYQEFTVICRNLSGRPAWFIAVEPDDPLTVFPHHTNPQTHFGNIVLSDQGSGSSKEPRSFKTPGGLVHICPNNQLTFITPLPDTWAAEVTALSPTGSSRPPSSCFSHSCPSTGLFTSGSSKSWEIQGSPFHTGCSVPTLTAVISSDSASDTCSLHQSSR